MDRNHGLLLQGTHARLHTLYGNTEPEPEDRELRQVVETIGTGKTQAVAAADRRGLAAILEEPDEGFDDRLFLRAFKGFERSASSINRPILVAVLKDWVSDTKDESTASSRSTSFAMSLRERMSRSVLVSDDMIDQSLINMLEQLLSPALASAPPEMPPSEIGFCRAGRDLEHCLRTTPTAGFDQFQQDLPA